MEIYSDEEDDMQAPRTPMSTASVVGTDKDANSGSVDQIMIPSSKASFCWLCLYSGNKTANEVIKFVLDGIAHMCLDSLVDQSKYLLDNVEPESNCTESEIRRHICEHMLNPRVKLALAIHEMSKMQKEVRKCCVIKDAETGEQTLNPQAMRVYLTLSAQMTSLYKTGEEKLIFNSSSMDK
jgi:hypothetical protein